MRIMDSGQFCELAKISKPTLHFWLNEGVLKRKMFNGRALYFTQEDLEKVPEIKKMMKGRRYERSGKKNEN